MELEPVDSLVHHILHVETEKQTDKHISMKEYGTCRQPCAQHPSYRDLHEHQLHEESPAPTLTPGAINSGK